MEVSQDQLDRLADVAYGKFYSTTDPTFTGKQRAWRGSVETNPLRRPILEGLKAIDVRV